MRRSRILLGAGGCGKDFVWLIEEINAEKAEWRMRGFLDSHPAVQGMSLLGYPVLGRFEDAPKFPDASFVVAFGDPRMREHVASVVSPFGVRWANLISPTARIHGSSTLGTGVVIGRYADMTAECAIGDHVLLNLHSVLGHGVRVGDFSIVSPNVTINGGASIGRCCYIGANAFVRDVAVGDYATVAASACVVRPVEPDCVVAGVPARVVRKGPPLHSVTKTLRGDGARAVYDPAVEAK